MADQLTDAEWEHLASVMGNPKVQQYLQQTFAAQKEGIPEGAIEEEDAPKPKKQSKPKTRTRTNGASYHTQAEIEEPEESAANTAGTYQVPQKKTRVSAAIRRKQQYLEACANKDASGRKVTKNGIESSMVQVMMVRSLQLRMLKLLQERFSNPLSSKKHIS